MPVLLRGDARALPLPDESVDLVVTSPPYFGLRDYGYDGQIGAEPTPAEFLDALIACTREMVRVLKPSGSIWVNLGDSYYSGKGAPGRTTIDPKNAGRTARREGKPALDAPGLGFPRKSLLLLPHRYAIRCIDELGLIVRQDQVWLKSNGLPESVVDRTRRSHEYFFHIVKQPRYYSAVDEIREQYAATSVARAAYGFAAGAEGGTNGKSNGTLRTERGAGTTAANPLGKLPGSVWEIPTQPLNVPDHVSHAVCCGGRKRDGCVDGLDHYAAYPFNLVRPIILGWSPREVCTACGEGRRPTSEAAEFKPKAWAADQQAGGRSWHGGDPATRSLGIPASDRHRSITGYVCACPDTSAPSTPGVVLDPFGGTSTTALVATMLGRRGVSVELSTDYIRLAKWRCSDAKERARAAGLDPDRVAKVKPQVSGQVDMFDLMDGGAA